LSGEHIPAKRLQIFVYHNQWLAIDSDTLLQYFASG